MSLNEFRGSQEFEEVQKLNQAIRDGIESTGIPNGMATQGGVTTQDALDLSTSFREDKTDNTNKNKEKSNTNTKTSIPYRNPLRKIAGGRVLQYPISLNTDLQDYFEIQVFRYKPAGSLPQIGLGNQDYGQSYGQGGYLSASNRRGNRQNLDYKIYSLQFNYQCRLL